MIQERTWENELRWAGRGVLLGYEVQLRHTGKYPVTEADDGEWGLVTKIERSHVTVSLRGSESLRVTAKHVCGIRNPSLNCQFVAEEISRD